jgi:hypothetical protein
MEERSGMSSKAVAAVVDARGLSLSERAVLFRLADQADDCGYVWLGIERIAEELESTKRTIQRILRGRPEADADPGKPGLLERGYVNEIYPGGGRGRPALLRVLPFALTDAPEKRRGRDAYERRYRKGDNLSRLTDRERVTVRTVNGDRTDRKGRPYGHPIHKETQRNAETADDDGVVVPLRREGESVAEWLERNHRESSE